MTEQKLNELIALKNKLHTLESIRRDMEDSDNKYYLTYKCRHFDEAFGDSVLPMGRDESLAIADILDKHDNEIRKEIDDAIKKIKQHIEQV